MWCFWNILLAIKGFDHRTLSINEDVLRVYFRNVILANRILDPDIFPSLNFRKTKQRNAHKIYDLN